MAATIKPFNLDKKQVFEAFKAVKSNGGTAGVDGRTLEQFEADLKNNLYPKGHYSLPAVLAGWQSTSVCGKSFPLNRRGFSSAFDKA